MEIILFAVVIGMSFVYFSGVQYIRQKKFIQKETDAGKKFTVFNYSQTWSIINALMVVSCIVFGILYRHDPTSIAIAIALGGSFVGNVISSQIKRKLYYNNKGFIMNETYIRYQSIKEIVSTKRIIPIYEIVTYNGARLKTVQSGANFVSEMLKTTKVK